MNKSRESESVPSSPETPSGSPGAILRRCREFHGITLEEASETTKIGAYYLKSLENDQIREFANHTYLRGFLRIYVVYLGLNFDDIAPMYDKLFGIQSDKPDPDGTAVISRKSPRRLVLLKKTLLPAFLLAVIIITATFFKDPAPQPARLPQPAAAVPAPPQIIAVQDIQSSVRVEALGLEIPPPKPEKLMAKPAEAEKNVTPPSPVVKSKGFILKISVTQNGTLSSTVDGDGPQQYELNIGDVIEWKAEKKITLELSNAGGVDVELNGNPYKPLGLLGKPAYVELDADGIKE